MRSIRILKSYALPLVAAMLLLTGSVTAQNKKNSSPPPRPAPASRPAPAARSSAPAPRPGNTSGRMNRGGSYSGPSANRSGPSANGPMANRPTSGGYNANRPAGNEPTKGNRFSPITNRPSPTTGGVSPRMGSIGGGAASGHPGAIGTNVNFGYGRTVNAGITGRPAPRGAQPLALRNGSAIQRRPNGRISDVHDAQRGLDIHRGLNGSRRVSVERADHSRIFAERGRPGFVQHPYRFRGHDFARRTYYYHGRAYDRFYRHYEYHGVAIEVYSPVRYYPVGFYGWAYNPWYHPVVFAWGWGASPWVRYYGSYFAPYPTYSSAPYWLTDYMVSQDLSADYQAEQGAQTLGPPPQGAGGAPEITPEIKQQIADEVRDQIALENSEAQQNSQSQEPDPASSGIARLLSDGHTHTFVAGSDMDVVDASGNECALSGGDVLELTSAPAPDAEGADLVVLASKGGQECTKSDTVTIALSDLQDMQNHMRETIDQGLQELQAKQGSGGLPPAPPSAQAPPVETDFAQTAPPPDPNGAAEVNQQLQQADAAEQEVTAQAQQQTGIAMPPPARSAPVTIALGQSFDQVTGELGQPQRVIDLGLKKIYEYQGMKITFKNGKVSDVQ
jgi:hypothetical protein